MNISYKNWASNLLRRQSSVLNR